MGGTTGCIDSRLIWVNCSLPHLLQTPVFCRRKQTSCIELKYANRPLARKGHVTIASLKQQVGILLLPKIDRTHKSYLTHKICKEMHLREISYGTLIFQQSNMICMGRIVGGHTLALQHGGQNYFFLKSCQMFDGYVQCAINVTTSSFNIFLEV